MTAAIDGDDDLGSVPAAGPAFCDGCGRELQVLQLAEVVVHDREQALRWIEGGGLTKVPNGND